MVYALKVFKCVIRFCSSSVVCKNQGTNFESRRGRFDNELKKIHLPSFKNEGLTGKKEEMEALAIFFRPDEKNTIFLLKIITWPFAL